MDSNGEQFLVEEREEILVNLDGTAKSMWRKGWFVKPPEYMHDRNLGGRFFPLVQRPIFDSFPKHDLKVTFKGWPNPRHTWDQWVSKLRPKYEEVWKKAGILDAIVASTYTINKDLTSIWEVLPYWCHETNTFLFPLQEATITLEDMMVLGGFSPIGRCPRGVGPLPGELEKINLHLLSVHKSFNNTKVKKPSFSAWLNHFIECSDSSTEHIAFLILFLSRHVFPKAPEYIVQKELFPIAILLAQGERFALGPTVLASLYGDMQLLKEYWTSSRKDHVLPISVWAPFHLLQMWVWERITPLRPNAPNFIEHNKPRATRWHDLGINRGLFTGLAVQSPKDFQWRPYAKNLDNWIPPPYCRGNGDWICANGDDEVISFAWCLRPCRLVGLDNVHLYHPQRVSRQFGFDQDLLGCALADCRISDWVIAWSSYMKDMKNSILYVPPQDFESDVTYQYYSQWKQNKDDSIIMRSEVETLVMETKEEISIRLQKKARLETDLNSTPLDLTDTPQLLAETVKSNIRLIKAIMRKRQASPSANLTQNQLIRYPNEEGNLAAAGGVERQDGLHECDTAEYKSPGYGPEGTTSDDLERHKWQSGAKHSATEDQEKHT